MGGTRAAVSLSFFGGLILCALYSLSHLYAAGGPARCNFLTHALPPHELLTTNSSAGIVEVVVVVPEARLRTVKAVINDLSDLFSQMATLQLSPGSSVSPVTLIAAGGSFDSSPLGLWQAFIEDNALDIAISNIEEHIFIVDDWLVASLDGVLMDVIADLGSSDGLMLFPVCNDESCILRPLLMPTHQRDSTVCCVPSDAHSTSFPWSSDPAPRDVGCVVPGHEPLVWPCAQHDRRVCHDRPLTGNSIRADPWAACLLQQPQTLSLRSNVAMVYSSEAVTPLFVRDSSDAQVFVTPLVKSDRTVIPKTMLLSNGRVYKVAAAAGECHSASINSSSSAGCASGRIIARSVRLSETAVGLSSLYLAGNSTSSEELREALCRHVVLQIARAADWSQQRGRQLASGTCNLGDRPLLPLTEMHELERSLAISRLAAARTSILLACKTAGLPEMIAPAHVDAALDVAWNYLLQAEAHVQNRAWTVSSIKSIRAIFLAETSRWTSDVLWDLHTPLWHVIAIYVPPWGPLVAPVLLGLLAVARGLWMGRLCRRL